MLSIVIGHPSACLEAPIKQFNINNATPAEILFLSRLFHPIASRVDLAFRDALLAYRPCSILFPPHTTTTTSTAIALCMRMITYVAVRTNNTSTPTLRAVA